MDGTSADSLAKNLRFRLLNLISDRDPRSFSYPDIRSRLSIMTEVTSENFEDILPLVIDNIKAADFIAIDCEFTGLSADPALDTTLFDTPDDRYKKLRSSASKLTICQFGLCTFTRTPTTGTDSVPVAAANRYEGKCFTFYLCPKSFSDKKSKKMMLNTSSIEFLADHEFNFKKWLKTGIPFMNQQEEEYLREMLQHGDIISEICNERDDRMDQMFTMIDQIRSFEAGSEVAGDVKDTMQILIPFAASVNQLRTYAMIKRLRQIFPNVWIRLLNGHLLVKRMPDSKDEESEEEREARDLAYNEEEDQAIEYMRGFSRVIQSLIDCQKVLVGHNCFTDLIFMFQHLYSELPKQLTLFKKQLQQLFPMIYDTKHMIMIMKKSVPELKFLRGSGLSDLYDQLGLPEYSANFHYNPIIELMSDENAVVAHTLKKHDAGSDAYACGFVFIKLAHAMVMQSTRRPETQPSWLQYQLALEPFLNRVNLIRAAVHHVNLAGEDDLSARPPWIFVRKVKGTLELNEILSLVGQFGRIDARSLNQNEALIAAGNILTAQDVMKELKGSKLYNVKVYTWRQNRYLQCAWLTVVTATGCLAAILAVRALS